MVGYNIYHRRDGRFEGRISRGKQKNGRRRFHYFFGKTREEVKKKIDAHRSQVAHSYSCDMTMGEIIKKWAMTVKHNIKESTAANYRMKLDKHILPVFSERRIDAITSDEIYSFIDSKLNSGLSSRYVADILVLLKTIFKYAVQVYHIQNPLTAVSTPKIEKTDIELLDDDQRGKLEQYIAENPNHTTLGIGLSMVTGIRVGELCALKWEDIDFKKRVMSVRKTIQRIQTPDCECKTKLIIAEPKSRSSKREIPLPECIIEFLEKFKGSAKEYVISGTDKPTEPRTMQYRFKSILKNAKLPSVHFHALRHMFATRCVKIGFDIKTLSELLGHSSVELTLKRYVHSSFERKIECMSLVSASF